MIVDDVFVIAFVCFEGLDVAAVAGVPAIGVVVAVAVVAVAAVVAIVAVAAVAAVAVAIATEHRHPRCCGQCWIFDPNFQSESVLHS